MSETERLKIQLTHKKQNSLIDGGGGSWIVASIKNGKLSDGTAWTIDTEHLLASVGRALENPHIPSLHDVEAGARFTFTKNCFAGRVAAGNRALSQEVQLTCREA